MLKIDLKKFNNIIFFTGAGMSKESGVDTYRGEDGRWEEYNWREYACQKAFLKDPSKVLRFHELRRKEIFSLTLHKGYYKIKEIQKIVKNLNIITQNIDGFHKRSLTKNIIELHGSLWNLRCEKENLVIEDKEKWNYKNNKCDCGSYYRPDIIWFEDELNNSVYSKAINLISQCDIFISIGTSGIVYPAASLPKIAKQSGAFLVEINPEETELSYIYDEKIREKATVGIKNLFNNIL
tara:strand:+ start:1118 stop:1828 length:711 start_codon:yes stop_codon:yes gene_type:complete